MFRNGAWGPPEDARAAEEWKRVQTELAEAVKRAPEQPAAEMEKVFEKEKRLQDAGWVGFSDMNNGKEGKRTQCFPYLPAWKNSRNGSRKGKNIGIAY
jgi:hypothetical protein